MSFKDSGIEWIGQIPSHWHTLSVSKAYDITLGKMLQPNLNNSNDFKVPYLKAMNVQDGYVNLEKIEEMYCSTNELNSFKLECGDLVVCEGGEVARSAVIKENLAGFIFQNSVHRVKGTAKGDTRFLHYLLIALRASGFINILVNKATIAHFTKDKFNSLKIALPQLNEQLKISDYLDYKTYKIETLIKAKQMLIDLLEQQRQSIITEAVAKGLNPNVKMKESGVEWIGEIPEHWKVKPLYSLYNENKLKNKGNENKNVLSLSYGKIKRRDVESNYGLLPDSFETYQILKKGDIILRLTDLQNDKRSLRVGLVNEDGIITNAYLGLKQSNKSTSQYTYYLLHSYDLMKVFYGLGSGVRQSIGYTEMKKLPILLPPLEEQLEIIEFLKVKVPENESVIELLKKQIKKLKEYRQSLIYEAVTGKIDVRDMELD